MKRESHWFIGSLVHWFIDADCVLGFISAISKSVLLKGGTSITVDRDSLLTVQPNLRAIHLSPRWDFGLGKLSVSEIPDESGQSRFIGRCPPYGCV